AYRAVLASEPGYLNAVRGVVMLGPALGRWDETAALVLGSMKARERFDQALLVELERTAVESHQIDPLVRAVEGALAKAGRPGATAPQVHLTAASWPRDRRNDAGGAIAALRKSLELGGDRASTLSDLAALERTRPPSPPLLETLRRLSDADSRDLD